MILSIYCALSVIALTFLTSIGYAQSTSKAPDVSSITQLFQSISFQKNIFETVIIFLIAYIIGFVLIRIVNSRIIDIKARHIIRKNITYLLGFGFLTLVIFIWVKDVKSITLILGVASAGLALALQEVILSIAGWFLILIRRPYAVGDRIELGGVRGDVIDIRLFQTSLLEIGNWIKADQSTGRIVNIPNSAVFKNPNFNYSRGFEFIWDEMPILVTFESDWKRARDILISQAKNLREGMEGEVERKIKAMSNRYMIFYGKLTPIVYVKIQDSGVLLTLRYLTEAKKRRFNEDNLSRGILEEFEKEPNVNFAYPTYRIVKE